MTTKTLTPHIMALAVEHCGVLVLAGEERSAAMLEADLKDRFIDAVAQGLCHDPVGTAKALSKIKDIAFERSSKPCPCAKHKLDAILGPVRQPSVSSNVP